MERLVKSLGDVKCDDHTHSDRVWEVTIISINPHTTNTARVLEVTKRACTCPVCGPIFFGMNPLQIGIWQNTSSRNWIVEIGI